MRGAATDSGPRPAAAPLRSWGQVDPVVLPPEGALAGAVDPVLLLREGLLPWRRSGAVTVVLAADPGRAQAHLPLLARELGPVRLAAAAPDRLAEAQRRTLGPLLARAAEERCPPWASCRTLPRRRLLAVLALAAGPAVGLAVTAPAVLVGLLTGWTLLTLALLAGLRAAALMATLRRDRTDAGAEVIPSRWPVVSLLVPLYREQAVAGHLLRRLGALDYPRDRLEVRLILEDDDPVTRAALGAAVLPSWAQVVEVPEGLLRTKPRALNHALRLARGTIVGIYDAEDVPAPDHLRRVAARFARRGPEVACIQGVLDYFNARRNWMARCFALEYAAWFRVLLPGLARLGCPVPLGGTTLFLRREALEAAGGWDAHNVTEDADLGLRLARLGYRTEILPIVTEEEANARPWAWIRQRSRWLKGYAVTYAVHMRDPARLWREMGSRGFWAVQILFLGTLSQFALAPLLWALWLVPFELAVHPLGGALPERALLAASGLCLLATVLDWTVAGLGARRAGKAGLSLWAPTLPLYFAMGTFAVWRALAEAVLCPFRWDKTAHGLDMPTLPRRGAAPSPPVTGRPAPWRRRA